MVEYFEFPLVSVDRRIPNLNGDRFALFLLPSVCADDSPGEEFSQGHVA